MALAIQAVREVMPKRKVARIFQVPRTTLLDKLYGRVEENCSLGSRPVLSKSEEESLVQYVVGMAKIGYPLTRGNLASQVKKILDEDSRSTPFTNNLPGTTPLSHH